MAIAACGLCTFVFSDDSCAPAHLLLLAGERIAVLPCCWLVVARALVVVLDIVCERFCAPKFPSGHLSLSAIETRARVRKCDKQGIYIRCDVE